MLNIDTTELEILDDTNINQIMDEIIYVVYDNDIFTEVYHFIRDANKDNKIEQIININDYKYGYGFKTHMNAAIIILCKDFNNNINMCKKLIPWFNLQTYNIKG